MRRPLRLSGRLLRAAAIIFATVAGAMVTMGDMPRTVSNPRADLAGAIDGFGFRLLHQLVSDRGSNLIISPLSVWLALAMTADGAHGATRDAILRVLGMPSSERGDLHGESRDLLSTLRQADPSVRLDIANALWAQSGFRLEPGFVESSEKFYDATVESLDFIQDPHQAVVTINAWVNRKTGGRIPAVMDRLGPSTRLVLTDAVYFKGDWTSPFDKKSTTGAYFHLPDGSQAKASMMARRGSYPYLETAAFQAIRLPYGNRRFAMYVFLPRTVAGLPELMGALDRRHWQDWMGRFVEREGRIVLPRFEPTYSASLNDALKAMGMGIAYDARRADFSGIHRPPPPLSVDDVEHKTYVQVNEEGTRATAATGVSIVITAVLREPRRPFEMVVDHPFVCAVADAQSGVILFVGMISNPGVH